MKKWLKRLWSWFPHEPPPEMKQPGEMNQPDNDTPFMYIFVREDLQPVGKLIQVAHTTHNAGVRFGMLDPDQPPLHFCVFGVKNEQALQAVAWRLNQQGYEFELFFEPDFETGDTAIAVQPQFGTDRDWFRNFKLLKM